MMPVLIAEESLRETERIGVGITGWGFKPAVARDVLRGWREDAVRHRVARTPSRPASPEILGGMGIGYRVVKPKP